jgi:hypothetical protein
MNSSPLFSANVNLVYKVLIQKGLTTLKNL